MRWIFVILLILNVIYFGWELDRQTRLYFRSISEVLPVPAGVKKLQLVSESRNADLRGSNAADKEGVVAGNRFDSTQKDVMLEPSVVDELLVVIPPIQTLESGRLGEPTFLCYTYGPIPDQEQAIDLLTWFQDRQIDVKQRFEQDQEKALLWIYLAPQASRDGAIKALESLKKQGVEDYQLIESGSLQNAISLGLFATQASVNRRLKELKGKGYQPVVVPYRDADAIYWIDVRLSGDSLILNQMYSGLPARFNSVPVSCSEIALP